MGELRNNPAPPSGLPGVSRLTGQPSQYSFLQQYAERPAPDNYWARAIWRATQAARDRGYFDDPAEESAPSAATAPDVMPDYGGLAGGNVPNFRNAFGGGSLGRFLGGTLR